MTFARRQYQKLLFCLEDLENRINTAKEEDVTLYYPIPVDAPPFTERSAVFSLKDVHPAIIRWMRAEVLIELGEPGRAVSEAKASLASLPQIVREGNFLFHPVEKRRLERAFALQPGVRGSGPLISLQSFPMTASGTLALAHALRGERQEALELAREVEKETSRFILYDFSQLTRVHFALGNYARVLELFNQTSSLWRYLLLGAVALGQTASAIANPMQAIQGVQGLIGLTALPFAAAENERGFGMTSFKYAALHSKVETGDIESAAAGFDDLLKNPYLPNFNNLYWAILYDMGRIAEKRGDPEKALDYYRRAIEQIEKLRSNINYEAGMIGFVGDKQPVYRAIVALLVRQQKYDEAFEYAERAKARALVDLLAQKKDFAVRGADPQKVRQLLAQTGAPEAMPATLEEASKTRNLADSAQEEIKQRAPELTPLISVPPVKLADIAAKLPVDEALVSYFYTDKELFAFVLTSQGLRAAKLDREGLEEKVRQLRRAIQSRTSEYLDASRRLHDQLLRPIESLLQQKITIAPHGILHYLPFAALHDGTRFAIERYNIRILPSASTLLYLRSDKSQTPGQILAFGNPDLGNPELDLKFAQQEALEVAKTFSDSRALIRKEATKAALKELGPGFRYVHFATHGQFNANEPLASALLLARTDEEDGRLTIGDLYSLRIDADLVSMSACETGLGKIANGDDVIGLTRGFLYAGARSIVASLWQIDDKATEDLMTRFYKYLTETDKREALRKAQLETREAFPHPFFWGAFQIIGNAD